tara:strand:- start:64 stop:1080 length:1017 start_codon:yes stop_codon:yes gene_type:complete
MEVNTSEVAIQETALRKKEQLENFKSLYYFFKSKRDTDIKLYSDSKQFRSRDIKELNNKINDKIRLHKSLTQTTQVTIGLENGRIIPFGTWESFQMHDWNCSETTRYISIEWDFNFLIENQYQEEIPQTHTLRIRMGNGLKPSEMIQVLFQGGEEHELEEAQAQMVCKIDFVNAQICAELKNIVTEWYNALSKNSEEQKFIPVLVKHREKIKQTINILFILSGILLCQGIFKKIISLNSTIITSQEILTQFYIICSYSIVIMYAFYIAGKFYSDRIIGKTIRRLNRYPMFEFTKGDENKKSETEKKNKKLIKQLFIGILISIFANIITYGITELLKVV